MLKMISPSRFLLSCRAFFCLFLLAALCASHKSHAQITVKFMQYNLLQYNVANPPSCTPSPMASKDIWLKDILNAYQPDIFTVNEMAPDVASANRVKVKSLTYRPMSYAGLTNTKSSDIANMLFYDPAKFVYKSVTVIDGVVRDIDAYTLYEKSSAANNDTTWFICIVGHFKAGSGTANENERSQAATNVMTWVAQNAAGKNVLFMGDCNIYGSTEPAYQTFINYSNTSARFSDPSGVTSGWGYNERKWLTQSTQSAPLGCASGGGLDDRFDLVLASNAIMNGTSGIQYVPNSFMAFGNDGTAYNTDINCTNNPTVTATVCGSLKQMSDHLPVVLQLTFSKAVAVEEDLQALTSVHLNVLGNPVSDRLIAEISTANPFGEPLLLELINGDGKIVQRLDYRAQTYFEPFAMDVAHLSEGLYILRVKNGQGRQLFRKICIAR